MFQDNRNTEFESAEETCCVFLGRETTPGRGMTGEEYARQSSAMKDAFNVFRKCGRIPREEARQGVAYWIKNCYAKNASAGVQNAVAGDFPVWAFEAIADAWMTDSNKYVFGLLIVRLLSAFPEQRGECVSVWTGRVMALARQEFRSRDDVPLILAEYLELQGEATEACVFEIVQRVFVEAKLCRWGLDKCSLERLAENVFEYAFEAGSSVHASLVSFCKVEMSVGFFAKFARRNGGPFLEPKILELEQKPDFSSFSGLAELANLGFRHRVEGIIERGVPRMSSSEFQELVLAVDLFDCPSSRFLDSVLEGMFDRTRIFSEKCGAFSGFATAAWRSMYSWQALEVELQSPRSGKLEAFHVMLAAYASGHVQVSAALEALAFKLLERCEVVLESLVVLLAASEDGRRVARTFIGASEMRCSLGFLVPEFVKLLATGEDVPLEELARRTRAAAHLYFESQNCIEFALSKLESENWMHEDFAAPATYVQWRPAVENVFKRFSDSGICLSERLGFFGACCEHELPTSTQAKQVILELAHAALRRG